MEFGRSTPQGSNPSCSRVLSPQDGSVILPHDQINRSTSPMPCISKVGRRGASQSSNSESLRISNASLSAF